MGGGGGGYFENKILTQAFPEKKYHGPAGN